MALKEFEVNGEKILVNDEFSEKETGIVSLEKINNKLEKTQEIKVISDEELLENTTIDLFEENKDDQ